MPSHLGSHRSILTPTTVPTLTVPPLPTLSLSPVLQLDASNAGSLTTSGGLVSAWTDLVTGTYQFTATLLLRPTLVSSVYGPFSLPTVRFNGSANYMIGSAVLAAMNGTALTLILIAANTSGTGGYFFDNDALAALTTGFGVFVSSTPAWDFVTGDGTTAHGLTKTLVNGKLCMFIGEQDGAASGAIPGSKNQGIYLDSNTLAASGTFGYTAQTTVPPTLGGSSAVVGSHLLTGDICEVIGFGGALTNADVNNLHFYARSKWGTL